MINILTGVANNPTMEIIGWIVIGLAFLAAIITAFMTGRLSLKKIIKNPKVLKDIYDETLKSLDKKIHKAERKEEKADEKGDVDRALKYQQQKELMTHAREGLLEPTETIVEEPTEAIIEEPKLDNESEL